MLISKKAFDTASAYRYNDGYIEGTWNNISNSRSNKAIKLLYTDSKAKVVTSDGQTDLFEILAGVLLGNILPPYLFVIAIDYSMNQAIWDDEAALGLTLVLAKS